MSSINNRLKDIQEGIGGSLGGSLDDSKQANQSYSDFDAKYKRFLLAFNAASGADLARIFGIKPQSVDVARKRKQLPSKWISEAFLKYGISADWLLSGTGPMRRGETVPTTQSCLSSEDFEIIPLLESRVVAGPEGEILFEEIADYYPFKKWWVEKLVGKSPERKKDLLMVKVRGDSMSPTINQGEAVLVDTFEGERVDIKVGKIYIVTMPDGSTAIKRLAISREDGKTKLICISDNVAAYLPFEFDLEPGRPIQSYVIGRVRWAGKEFD